MTEGLHFRLEAGWQSEDELAAFLEARLPERLYELPLTAAYAVRYGTTSFGVFAFFEADAAQRDHVGRRLAEVLREQEGLLTTTAVEGFDVLAAKTGSQAVSP
jgi:hypothetical protein